MTQEPGAGADTLNVVFRITNLPKNGWPVDWKDDPWARDHGHGRGAMGDETFFESSAKWARTIAEFFSFRSFGLSSLELPDSLKFNPSTGPSPTLSMIPTTRPRQASETLEIGSTSPATTFTPLKN
jgi:hypothetical protein